MLSFALGSMLKAACVFFPHSNAPNCTLLSVISADFCENFQVEYSYIFDFELA
jgi:hypothetical protein